MSIHVHVRYKWTSMSFLSMVMSMYVVIGVHSHDNRRLTWRNTVHVSCTSTSHYQLTRWYVGVLWEWVTCGEWSLELWNVYVCVHVSWEGQDNTTQFPQNCLYEEMLCAPVRIWPDDPLLLGDLLTLHLHKFPLSSSQLECVLLSVYFQSMSMSPPPQCVYVTCNVPLAGQCTNPFP